jgi:hypothetical protein
MNRIVSLLRYRMVALATLLAVALLGFAAPRAGAAVPPIMSYQGYLTDNGGTPLTGSYTLAFKLYADSLITTPLWTESYAGVPVSGGVFHVALGSVSPLDATILSGAKLYLVTSVNGVDVLPRRPIVTVAYAFRAGVADSAAHVPTTTGHITGQVQVTCGSGINAALVYIAGRSFVAYTASDGTFDLSALPPGSYKVHIEAGAAGATDIGPLTVTAGGTNNIGIVALGGSVLTDPANCGTCGNVCNYANANAACVGGNCQIGSCTGGYANCDANPANGCETNVVSNVNNCGSCGLVCTTPNGSPACTGGACTVGSCNPGYANCDFNAGNGCETNVVSNVNNCGSCGLVCSTPNATSACAGGVCTVGSCNVGYANCDLSAGNGCEVNTTADLANCGSCGLVCPTYPHTLSSACVASTCQMGACAVGYSNCDNVSANGCEINTTADVNNCGACGVVCAALPHTVSTSCLSGSCGIGACASGYRNCDGANANGCEINTNNDSSNCGTCGNVCPSGHACSAGVCL